MTRFVSPILGFLWQYGEGLAWRGASWEFNVFIRIVSIFSFVFGFFPPCFDEHRSVVSAHDLLASFFFGGAFRPSQIDSIF